MPSWGPMWGYKPRLFWGQNSRSNSFKDPPTKLSFSTAITIQNMRSKRYILVNNSFNKTGRQNLSDASHVVIVIKLVSTVWLGFVVVCIGGFFISWIAIFYLLHFLNFYNWERKLSRKLPPSHPASSLHRHSSILHNPGSCHPSPTRRSTCSISLGSCSLFGSCRRDQRWWKQPELRPRCSSRYFWSPHQVLCQHQLLKNISINNKCESTSVWTA